MGQRSKERRGRSRGTNPFKHTNKPRLTQLVVTKHEPEPLEAKTPKQAEYLQALHDFDQVVCMGPSGTGKSYCAASYAADMLIAGKIQKIVLTRPAVGVDEDLGFLPGGLDKKIEPWVVPITEVLEARLGRDRYKALLVKKELEVVPLSYMRGRTFHGAFVLLDEAQNTTYNQIKMFLTRIGEGSKVLINGDIRQSDLKKDSGLAIILQIIAGQKLHLPVVEFTDNDVVRSGICRVWTKAFATHEDGNK